MPARETLIEELQRHALVIGEVTLTSGATAQYYVDAKRAILRPAGFGALGELVAAYAREWEATAVGGLTMGADAPALAALAGGADVKAFFVRKETKQHGLQRRVEGPPLKQGERCLIVEDVVTTGGSTVAGDRRRPRRGPRRLRRARGRRSPRRRRRGDRARGQRRALRAAHDDRRAVSGPAGSACGGGSGGESARRHRLIDRVGCEDGFDDHDGGADDAGAVVEGGAGDAD